MDPPPLRLSRWRAGDRAVGRVWGRLSLLLLACGPPPPPAGSRPGLGSVRAPAPAPPPVLPLDVRESHRVLPLLPGFLLLSFGHARWTFGPRSPGLRYRGGRHRIARTPRGIQTVSARFAPTLCCPAVSLPGPGRPEAAVPRPAPPLSHAVKPRSRTLEPGTRNQCSRPPP